MSDVNIRITDSSDLIGEEFQQAVERALTRIGLQAETYAKRKCPVDTGNLRNSITNAVDDKSAYVGTNVEYAVYVELPTSRTKAQPFLKPAVTEHNGVYKRIIEDEMKNA